MTPNSVRIGNRTQNRSDARLAGLPAVAWLAIAGLLSFLLHLPFFGLPMISDEGGYAYTAQRWLDGRGTLYHDIWISRPQGIFLAYGAILETLGSGAVALRVGAFIVSMLTLVLVWRFADLYAGPRVAAISVLLFAMLCGSPAVEGFTANAEVFMALPAAGCALVLLGAGRRDWARSWLIGAGALAGLATFFKPAAITMLPMAMLFVLVCTSPETRIALRHSAWIGAGFALVLAPAFVHGYFVGWDNFMFATITYRLNHQSSAANGMYRQVAGILTMLSRAWPVIFLAMVPVGVNRWINGARRAPTFEWVDRLSEGARVGIVANPPRQMVYGALDDSQLLLRLWLGASILGIAMGGDWWVHYLIQIIAPLSILIAGMLLKTNRLVTGFGKVALIGLTLLLLFVPYRFVAAGDGAATSTAIFHHAGYGDQEAVAEYLRENSAPETPIYAAFNEAALYYLADRPSSYRYLFDQELVAFPDSEERLIAMVESEHPPTYIIGTKQGAPFTDRGRAFWAAVSANYYLETIVHGVPIFRANSHVPQRLSIE